MPFLSRTLLALSGSSLVSAHSFISQIDIDQKTYPGFRPIPGSVNAPVIVGWSTTAFDQGWLGADSYTKPDIICHRNATNAQGHAPVVAGDKIHIQWNGWPQGHKGPVLDYLAPCGPEGCQAVDKSGLEFYKINERGLVNPTALQPYGEWATDQLIANNNSWLVEIPPSTKPGFYVLRSEIIALHNKTTGPQHYPQCVNLEITGTKSNSPGGVLAEAFYNSSQAGLDPATNITTGVKSYLIPGPTLISGAVSVSLSNPQPTGTGTMVTGTVTPTLPSVPTATVTSTASASGSLKNSRHLFARTTHSARGESRRWYQQGLGF